MINAIILLLILFPLFCYGMAWIFEFAEKVDKQNKPIQPPRGDVTIIGCLVDCGYFVPKFKESSNGNLDFVKRNGRVAGFCNYQNCDVCQGGPCKFAKDHPDKLGKSVFDDDYL